MSPDELARIHARAMTVPGPWSADTIRGLADAPGAILATHGEGFALGRVIADEAELLTLAVDPEARRQGLGRACLAGFEAEARARGARLAHLEVAASNAPALALYRAAGYTESGRRRGYYRHPDGQAEDALLMSRTLGPA